MQGRLTESFRVEVAALSVMAGLLCIAVRPALSAAGTIHNLGVVGTFSTSSHGYAVNPHGQVAGVNFVPLRAFRYDGVPGAGGIMHDLGTLGDSSIAYGINASGQVSGESTLISAAKRAFRYDGTPGAGGLMHDLGSLGGLHSGASGINDKGQVTGWSNTADGLVHAFRYDGTPGAGGIMRDLGSPGVASWGRAINSSGQVAGDFNPGTLARAFRYDGTPGADGIMRHLGTLGGSSSGARGINDLGQVVGFSDTTGNNATHAFRYDGTPGAGGMMHDLGTLGGLTSHAAGINNLGFVVGESARSGTSDTVAALWRPDLSIVDLDAWLDMANPAQGVYWRLLTARGITHTGLVTGIGYYDDGPGGLSDGARAFLLDASSLIPEPGALALIAVPIWALGRRRHSEKPWRGTGRDGQR